MSLLDFPPVRAIGRALLRNRRRAVERERLVGSELDDRIAELETELKNLQRLSGELANGRFD